MRRPPASSHRSRVYDPPYYVHGGFCLQVRSSTPDYDVAPDLSARTDALPPRILPTRLAALLRAGYSIIATLTTASRRKGAEGSAAVQRHARTTTVAQ